MDSVFKSFTLEFIPVAVDEVGLSGCFSRGGIWAYGNNNEMSEGFSSFKE